MVTWHSMLIGQIYIIIVNFYYVHLIHSYNFTNSNLYCKKKSLQNYTKLQAYYNLIVIGGIPMWPPLIEYNYIQGGAVTCYDLNIWHVSYLSSWHAKHSDRSISAWRQSWTRNRRFGTKITIGTRRNNRNKNNRNNLFIGTRQHVKIITEKKSFFIENIKRE